MPIWLYKRLSGIHFTCHSRGVHATARQLLNPRRAAGYAGFDTIGFVILTGAAEVKPLLLTY